MRCLRAVFAQWDRDGNGFLSPTELKRALLAAGIRGVDFDATFKELDKNGDGRVTFEEFDELVPFETRVRIEEALTEEGVMRSLYVPPEEWDDTVTAEALKWEQKVQMEAQRGGNQLRQNDILRNELGKG